MPRGPRRPSCSGACGRLSARRSRTLAAAEAAGATGAAEAWPPPYRLAGDSWCFLGLAPAASVRVESGPNASLLALFGLAPVLLQATRYTSAESIRGSQGSVSYAEISVTGVGRSSEGWDLLPLKLLVDLPLARELGEPYGFPKLLAPELRLAAGDWTLRALAGEGRVLSAARGLGAVLLTPPWLALRHARPRLLLPRTVAHARFEALAGISPAVGLASPALRRWACELVLLFPLGVLLRRFRFVLEEPFDRPR